MTIPLLEKGYIKATAAFAAFVILYFVSPASLVVGEPEIEARRLIDDYKHANVVNARKELGSNWDLEEDGGKLLAKTPTSPSQEELEKVRDFIRKSFDAGIKREAFRTLTDVRSQIFDCVDPRSCD